MNGEVLTPGTNRAADAPPRLNIHARGFWELQGQWRIQGRGPGGPGPPPYFSTKMRPEGRRKKFFFPLIDFVILDMCFYLVINKELI